MPPILVLGFAAGMGALLLLLRKQPEKEEKPPSSDREQKQEPQTRPQSNDSGSGGLDIASKGPAAVVTALTAEFGQIFANNFVSAEDRFTRESAPVVGATAGGILALSGAPATIATAVGAAPLVGFGIILIPAVAVTAAILGTLAAIEDNIRFARLKEDTFKINLMIQAGQYKEAWEFARQRAKDGFEGLGFSAPFVAAIPETVETDKGTFKTKDIMEAAYNPAQGGSIEIGRQYAQLVADSAPWMGIACQREVTKADMDRFNSGAGYCRKYSPTGARKDSVTGETFDFIPCATGKCIPETIHGTATNIIRSVYEPNYAQQIYAQQEAARLAEEKRRAALTPEQRAAEDALALQEKKDTEIERKRTRAGIFKFEDQR